MVCKEMQRKNVVYVFNEVFMILLISSFLYVGIFIVDTVYKIMYFDIYGLLVMLDNIR